METVNATDNRIGLLPDTFERIRLTSSISQQDWCDLLHIGREDYLRFRSGKKLLPESAMENVAEHFGLDVSQLSSASVDFKRLALQLSPPGEGLSERYTRAAHGRKRTTITSIDYLEARHGWRLRLDVLNRFGVSERALIDPFGAISMRLITDLLDYLHRRQFREADFFTMGAYSYDANRKTLLAKVMATTRSERESYELFFGDVMNLLERNCRYSIVKTWANGMTVDVDQYDDVAADMGVRHIGSEHICQLRAGVFAVVPLYIGAPMAHVHQRSCVHKGDDVCRYDIEYGPRPSKASEPIKRPFAI